MTIDTDNPKPKDHAIKTGIVIKPELLKELEEVEGGDTSVADLARKEIQRTPTDTRVKIKRGED